MEMAAAQGRSEQLLQIHRQPEALPAAMLRRPKLMMSQRWAWGRTSAPGRSVVGVPSFPGLSLMRSAAILP